MLIYENRYRLSCIAEYIGFEVSRSVKQLSIVRIIIYHRYSSIVYYLVKYPSMHALLQTGTSGRTQLHEYNRKLDMQAYEFRREDQSSVSQDVLHRSIWSRQDNHSQTSNGINVHKPRISTRGET